MLQKDMLIIGGGPAGLAAAIAAYDAGARDILILERDDHLGGILRQCIHNGFGLHRFGEELTGPEYAHRYEQEVVARGIAAKTGTMVLSLTSDRVVTATNPAEGIFHIQARTVILAMGCRERPRGALNIPGERPAGVYTAGMAQKLVNSKGYLPGRDVVILGSGDIGLIMARRMTLEGARVHAVCELMPHSSGLARNIEQCLRDYDIPLLLSHTVVELHGRERLSGVTIAAVDDCRRPLDSTRRYIPCDTLLLSVGLIPENELSRMAGIPLDPVTSGALVDQYRETLTPGIYACGNVLHVHDLVDYVSEEAALAGRAAATRVLVDTSATTAPALPAIAIRPADGVRYTVPARITRPVTGDITLYLRVAAVHRDRRVTVRAGETVLFSKKYPRLAPGEMVSLTLPAARLAALTTDEITVRLED